MNRSTLILIGIVPTLCVSAAIPLSEASGSKEFSRYEVTETGQIRKPGDSVLTSAEPAYEEGSVRITQGNFTYDLFESGYGYDSPVAEIMPGWDMYDSSFDIMQIFPDGRIEMPSTVEYNGKIYKVAAVSEFRWLKGITEFVIPSTVKVLRHEAFENASIREIVIPDGVEEMEYGVFRNCKQLQRVVCGKSLRHILGNSFEGCTSLTTFDIDAENPYLATIGGFLVSKENNEAMVYYTRGVKHLEIHAGIESLAEDLCRWDETLESVTVSEGVRRIGKYVFMECPNLKEVKLPSTLKELEWGAFSRTAIEELTVPDSVYWLADCVEECPSLRKIHIGKGTSMISKYGAGNSGCGHRIGKGSNNIAEISVDPENPWFASDEIGLYTKQKNTLGRIVPSLRKVDLSASGITAIGSDAASYSDNNEIILPEHLKIVDGRPFEGTNLTAPLHIPYTMTYCNWDITFGYKPRDIYYHSNIPHPYLSEEENMENEGITMHVPVGHKEAFENSRSYSHFNIVDDLPEQKMNCIDFGYHGDRFSAENLGTNGPAAEGALLIPSSQLAAYEGMQITGVNFDNSFSQSAYAFIDRLSTGERLAMQQLTPIDQSTMNHIRFDHPYTIKAGEDDLLVGIGFDDISNFPYSRMVNPVGNYWREKGQTEWIHGDPSSMTCMPTDHAWMWSVSIEGEKMPVDGRLMNVEVEPDASAGIYRVSGYFHNMSGMIANELAVGYTFHNPENAMRARAKALDSDGSGSFDGTVIVNVNADPMLVVPFMAEIPMPEKGEFVLSVDVASINGRDDDARNNSMVYVPVEGRRPSGVDGVAASGGVEVVSAGHDRIRICGAAKGERIELISLDGKASGVYDITGPVTEITRPVTSQPVIVKIGNIRKIII